MKKLSIISLVSLLALTACSNDSYLTRRDPKPQMNEALKEVQRTQQESGLAVLTDINENRLRSRSIERTVDSGDVSISVTNLPLVSVMNDLGAANYYTVMYGEGVQTQRTITIDLHDVSGEAAIRRVALAAGYAAAIDKGARTVTLSELATYTFRLPPHVLAKLDATYTVGGNPISSTSSSSGGGGSGGGGGGGSSGGPSGDMKAEFKVTGGMKSDAAGVAGLITSIAGANAIVKVAPDIGMVTVRSNAQSLHRVHQFLNRFANDAQRRVEIEASIMEVSLTDEFKYGIDWTRVFSNKTKAFQLLGANTVSNPSAVALYSKNSIAATIDLLRSKADVRVIASPRIMAMNHSPSVLFDGKQIPYLASITTTVNGGSGTGSTSQTSGTASFVVDGISLSVTADIVNDREVQLTLVPVLASVDEFREFTLGSALNKLSVPVQSSKQSMMQVISETGNTLVLGGIRYSSGKNSRSGIPGVFEIPVLGKILSSSISESEINREVVILLRSNIFIPSPFDVLFSESI